MTDVGFDSFEEVSLIRRGGTAAPGRCANFGWSEFEGHMPLHSDAHGAGHLVFPVITYAHDVGCAIAGGVAYRGEAFPTLAGNFVFGDLCARTVWAYDPDTGTTRTLATGLGMITAVREGPHGELFVLEHPGVVRQLVPSSPG